MLGKVKDSTQRVQRRRNSELYKGKTEEEEQWIAANKQGFSESSEGKRIIIWKDCVSVCVQHTHG